MEKAKLKRQMEDSWNEAVGYLEKAAAALTQIKTKPAWVSNECRRRATEIKFVADRFKRATLGLSEERGAYAYGFEESIRILSSAIGMVASGVQAKDRHALQLADQAKNHAQTLATAAIRSLMTEDQPVIREMA